MKRSEFSVVEYFPERLGQRCGYCKSLNSYISCGMWAHSMRVNDYQRLLDRGWRRSGQYLYKPCMNQTCCPMYTIRCDVGDLHISKSQKKVLKKFYNHLRFGDTPRDFQSVTGSEIVSVEGDTSADVIPSHMEDVSSEPAVVELDKIEMDASPSKETSLHIKMDSKDDSKNEDGDKIIPKETVDADMPSTSTGKRGTGDSYASLSRPRKAKLIRLENKYNKLRKRGMTEEEAIRLTYETRKTSPVKKRFNFEDYFPRDDDMPYFIHKFRTELHPVAQLVNNPDMLQETHRLYAKYQMAVHGDSPDECSMRQLLRFLVESPLIDYSSKGRPTSGFGSFHQQYWLDERLIAVGVIDILPNCISSVYFFYDPDLRPLSLGTYGSLHEICYTRGLTQDCPNLKFYYLGYYIHNCAKMNYKGRYCPSFLLCPETFTWHSIEKCLIMLDKEKYARFETDPEVVDTLGDINLSKVMILYKHRAVSYQNYRKMNSAADDDKEEVTEYAKLIGEKCCQRMLLYRN